MERILDDISFNASERAGEKIVITREYVREHIGDLVDDVDLSRYVL